MQDGITALALAAYHGHTQVVHILLNVGASPDIQTQVIVAVCTTVDVCVHTCV